MPSRLTLALLLVVLWLPAPLAAQRVERTLPASDDTLVDVQNLTGRVHVRGWDRPQVRVVAERRSRATEVHIEQAANWLHIHTHVLQTDIQASERAVDYEIWVPGRATLSLRMEAGQVEVEGVREVVKVDTVAASLHLREVEGTIEVTTTSGDVSATNCGGRLKVESVSGTLVFTDIISRSLTARTASGNIRYQGEVVGGGSYEFSTHQGAIELRLPPYASFELTARSVQGDVSNSFPLTPKSHGRVPPQPIYARSLFGTVQSGAALVRATTFSGNISIGIR